eukprot:SAG22_NODE_835_length_6917_cov_8.098709_4_plen_80_part_00
MAWGGINEKSDGQKYGMGILTRPFIAGGWTWTGWDYRGEPTPYAWPDGERGTTVVLPSLSAAFPCRPTTTTALSRRSTD